MPQAGIMLALNHPNIVQLFGFTARPIHDLPGKHSLYLVSKYCEGESMKKVLEWAAENKHLGLPTMRHMVVWAIQICKTMDFLHSRTQPIVHLDLKPENVLLDAEWGKKSLKEEVSAVAEAAIAAGRDYAAAPSSNQEKKDAEAVAKARAAALSELKAEISARLARTKIMICDLGTAQIVKKDLYMTNRLVGTPAFMPPEMLEAAGGDGSPVPFLDDGDNWDFSFEEKAHGDDEEEYDDEEDDGLTRDPSKYARESREIIDLEDGNSLAFGTPLPLSDAEARELSINRYAALGREAARAASVHKKGQQHVGWRCLAELGNSQE